MVTKLEVATVYAQRLALEQMVAAMKKAAADLARQEAKLAGRMAVGEPLDAEAADAFDVTLYDRGKGLSLRVRLKTA